MKADPVRLIQLFACLGTVLASCTSAGAGAVVSASVSGLPPESIVAAISEICIERGGNAFPEKPRSIRCHVGGRMIGFALSGNEPGLTLDVMALDGQTREPNLKELRDAVLVLLSQ